MKPRTKAVLILLGAVALVWLVVWPVYLVLPEIVPAHMDLAGNINRWGSKLEVLIMPLVFTFAALIAAAIVYVAPIEDEERLPGGVLSIAVIGVIVALMHPLGTYLGGNNGPELSRFVDAAIAAIVIAIGLAMPALTASSAPRPFCGLPSNAPLPTPEARQKAARIGRAAFVLHGSVALLLILAGFPSSWAVIYLVGGLVVLGIFLCVYFKRTLEPRPPR